MRLGDELPVDHSLATVYRAGAALCGAVLLVFACLGFADGLGFFETDGARVAGLSSNGLLSLISLCVGLLLLGGALVGGNAASTLNMIVGASFLLSGFVHLFLLGRPANILDFGMSNVVFSFVMGLLIVTFGMYGRVSGGLPHDNPYWRGRHPEQARREARAPGRALGGPVSTRPRRPLPAAPARGAEDRP
ncbi:DUF4383 domain-containing protein [Streptomyces sp. WMMC940]|uniref:DUF4383 domain-containing protein n=1 Tax=Streptomyces sp. WMMC940 TaxID=3015153 RepID=UPI0022B60F16|nr:DUF4383 domain-containing protein [Streptomyces sp. WMMC940]MCZ7457205.1 DUF4383 domain-containing protein [Streptomyces sp. WMMC940]